MRYLLLLILSYFGSGLSAQNFVEDFESGNLNNWDLIEGKADLATDPIVEGNHSLRLWNFKELEIPEALLIHKTFNDDFGTYSYYALGEGPASQADFYFHYLDSNNYYHISHKPLDSETPEFIISKVVNGIYTEMHKQGAVDSRGKWIYFSVERFCNGRMIVGFNNDDVLDVIDTDILVPGGIGLRSWNEFSFFDRIEFESYAPQLIELDTSICQGQSVELGENIFDQSGSYLDTLVNNSGCDSIVQLEVTIADSLLVDFDTILCPGSVILLGDQFIDSIGNYRMEYSSIGGCDSIVNWNVTESSKFDLGPDRAFCDDEPLVIVVDLQGSYLWNTGETSSEITIDQEGSYSINVLDINNCTQLDTIEIVNQCALQFFAANIFSPNADSQHDYWRPQFDFPPNDYVLTIFDRWGNILFQTSDPNESWDGKFQNNYVDVGVYAWHLVADTEKFTGDLTVIR